MRFELGKSVCVGVHVRADGDELLLCIHVLTVMHFSVIFLMITSVCFYILTYVCVYWFADSLMYGSRQALEQEVNGLHAFFLSASFCVSSCCITDKTGQK